MKRATSFLVISLTAILAAGCSSTGGVYGRTFGYSYPLPLMKLKGKKICGQKVCDPGINGVPFHYTKNVVAPDVKEGSTVKDIALQLVGRTVEAGDLSGRTPFLCSSDGKSPFSADDITAKGTVEGIETEYKREEKLRFDVKAKVEADLDAMKAIGLESSKLSLEAARAKLTAAYSQINESVLEFKGRYYVFGLDLDAYHGVFQTGRYPQCEGVLRTAGSPGRQLITDVGIVVFSGYLKEQGSSKVISDLEAELKSYGVPFSVTASIEHAVKKQLHQSLKTGFAVISERRSGRDSFYNAGASAQTGSGASSN